MKIPTLGWSGPSAAISRAKRFFGQAQLLPGVEGGPVGGREGAQQRRALGGVAAAESAQGGVAELAPLQGLVRAAQAVADDEDQAAGDPRDEVVETCPEGQPTSRA